MAQAMECAELHHPVAFAGNYPALAAAYLLLFLALRGVLSSVHSLDTAHS